MYDRFDPLGAALGLPPPTVEARHEWIGSALGQIVNVAAYSPAGEVVGHCFLAADKPGSAEIAVFVRQESRRKGIGAALLKKALEWGWAAELRRVWAMTACDNRAALRLLMSCGFRLTKPVSLEAELEIELPVPVGYSRDTAAASGSLVRREWGEWPGMHDWAGFTRRTLIFGGQDGVGNQP
jgi:GNAT superfamily N-acetyltransferase